MPRGIYNRKSIVNRFWEKVNIKSESECWNWGADKNNGGYGFFHINAKKYLAHRVVWILTYGEIPHGLCVCHECDNSLCCNPAHLFLGTHQDNMTDMVNKGRQNKAFGQRNGRSKLTETQVIAIRGLYQENISIKKLSEIYDINYYNVYNICKRRSWKHI